MTSKKIEFLPYLDDVYGAEDPSYARIEAELDISKIYYSVKQWLSWQERAVFCYLTLGFTLVEISQKINLDLHIVTRLERTLIGKLQHAATTTQADIDNFGTSDCSPAQTRACCIIH